MTISGKSFVEIDIDFTGKETTELRQQYLEEIAGILEKEYWEAIKAVNGLVEFYCVAGSRMQFMEISDLDILQLEIKAKANKFLKQNQ